MIGYKDKKLTVKTTAGDVVFFGFHRPDLEKPNWHYYETDSGQIYHFRKEHLVAVLENEHLAVVKS